MNLTGLKGMAAYHAYLRTMFFIRLVRETMDVTGKSYDDILREFSEMPDHSKKMVLLELIGISPLSDNDVMRLLSVHSDKNGIPYSKSNIGNLSAADGMKLCIKTLIACSESGDDLFFLSSNQINELAERGVVIEGFAAKHISNNANIPLDELISLSLNDAYQQLAMEKAREAAKNDNS